MILSSPQIVSLGKPDLLVVREENAGIDRTAGPESGQRRFYREALPLERAGMEPRALLRDRVCCKRCRISKSWSSAMAARTTRRRSSPNSMIAVCTGTTSTRTGADNGRRTTSPAGPARHPAIRPSRCAERRQRHGDVCQQTDEGLRPADPDKSACRRMIRGSRSASMQGKYRKLFWRTIGALLHRCLALIAIIRSSAPGNSIGLFYAART